MSRKVVRVWMNHLIIKIIFNQSFSGIAIKSMRLVVLQNVLQRDRFGSTRYPRPVRIGRWLSGVIDGVIDDWCAWRDNFNVQFFCIILSLISWGSSWWEWAYMIPKEAGTCTPFISWQLHIDTKASMQDIGIASLKTGYAHRLLCLVVFSRIASL